MQHSVGEARLQRGHGQLLPLPDLTCPDRLAAADIVYEFKDYAIASGIMENPISKIAYESGAPPAAMPGVQVICAPAFISPL